MKTLRKTNDEVILKMLQEGKTQKKIAEHFGVSDTAISKRVKILLPKPESLKGLSDKQQKFALEVAGGKNQTQAAMSSHDCISLSSAKSMGYQLMQKPDIQTAIAEIMQQQGLTRTYRIKRLKEHIDNADPTVSLRGLDQTWKLEGLYTEKHEHVVMTFEDFQNNAEQLKELDRQLAELEADDIIDAEIG